MAAPRRRPWLLLPALALVLAAVALHPLAAAAPDDAPAPGPDSAAKPPTNRKPKPPPKPPRRQKPPPPLEEANPPKDANPPSNAPAPSAEPPGPTPTPDRGNPPAEEQPARTPLAPALAPPNAPPPYPLLKLVLRINGPTSLDESQQKAVIDELNKYSGSNPFTFRTQAASAAGATVPGAKVRTPDFTPEPSPPPAQDTAAPAPMQTRAGTGGGGPDENSGKDGSNGKEKEDTGGKDGGDARRLRRLLLGAEGSAPHARRLLETDGQGDTYNPCPKSHQFVVASKEECSTICMERVEGKEHTYTLYRTFMSDSGASICCDCRIKKGMPEYSPTPQLSFKAEDMNTGEPWWPPGDLLVAPINADSVIVWADCAAYADAIDQIMENVAEASSSGALCDGMSANGVPCTSTVVLYQGTSSDVTIDPLAQANAAASTSSSSDGLSTGAIIGIVVGGCAGLAAIIVSVSIFISCRRERTIDRAVKLRTMSRRAEAAPEADSKWRQMYSARMAESVRRAEEASARQKAQASGPSFVEMQDREFAQQAATPQFSSKRSFGRGTPGTEQSGSHLVRESPDHSLMTGSELSSPPPSVSSKPGRSRSLKKLFSTGSK